MNHKRYFLVLLIGALSVTFFASPAQAQVIATVDMEGPLPGKQKIPDATGGSGWSFYGSGDPDPNALVVTEQVTDQVAFDGVQSFQIIFDTSQLDPNTPCCNWSYYGTQGFLGFWGEGFGAGDGQNGADNPARYELSFEVKVEGHSYNGDPNGYPNPPIRSEVNLYKGDYELVYGDQNGNGVDPNNLEGYDIWQSEYASPDVTDPNWTHVSWRLNSGTTPVAPSAEITTPHFVDESTFRFSFYLDTGGFGLDNDNVIYIDNLQLEFFPAGPGDFNGDDRVDGLDFLEWQRNPTVGSLSEWETYYGTSYSTAVVQAVPEPSTILLTLLAGLMLAKPVRRCVTRA